MGVHATVGVRVWGHHSWMMKNVAAAIYSSGSVDRIYEYVSSIPQEVRTGDALDKLWPEKGDIEVKSALSLFVVCSCVL